jgi:hypothetical protein
MYRVCRVPVKARKNQFGSADPKGERSCADSSPRVGGLHHYAFYLWVRFIFYVNYRIMERMSYFRVSKTLLECHSC